LGQALVATQPRGVRSMHWHVDEIPNVEAMAAFLQSSSRLESVTLTCRYDDYNNNNKEEEARRVNEKLVVLLEALSYNTSGRSIRTLHLMGASWENAVVAAGEEQQQQQQRQEGNANTLQTRLLSAIQRLDSLQKLSLSACSAQFNGILGQGLVGHPGIKSVELHGVPAQPGLLPSLRSCHIRINDGNTSSLSPFSGEGIRELDVESFLTFDTDGQDGISVMNSVLSKTLHLRSLKLTLFSDGNTELRKVISKLPLLEELQAREYSCNETDWLLDCRCLKSFACQRLSREGMTNLLTRHGSLESLTIHGPISEPDMLHLLQLLEHNTNVKKLCIGECALSAALMHRLKTTLTTNKTLQHLSLPTLDADFLTEIFGSHSISCSLQQLTLGSGIGRLGSSLAFWKAMGSHPMLTSVTLGITFSHAWWNLFLEALPHLVLHELKIEINFGRHLLYGGIHVDEFATALSQNTHLSKISILFYDEWEGRLQDKLHFICRLYGRRNRISQMLTGCPTNNNDPCQLSPQLWPYLFEGMTCNPSAIYLTTRQFLHSEWS